MSIFWSVCLGGGIGLLYAVLAYLTQRMAVRQSGSGFMGVLVGGMLIRMLVLLVLVGATLALVPVHPLSFTLALVVALLLGLGLDAWWLFRHLEALKQDARSSASSTPDA